jgi:Pyruvate/2-oxoacid:ferredoxin oxidoreductase delta subunit
MPQASVILSARRAPDELDALEREVLDHLCRRGCDCLVTPPLYHVAEASPLWAILKKRCENAVLLGWLHPRPCEWLLRLRRVDVRSLAIRNLAEFADAAAVVATAVELCKRHGAARDGSPGRAESYAEACAPRWYPLVDEARCTNCQHCLQFCLFGVYEADAAGRTAVRHPDRCKPGCPACARICPHSAIMFPLHERDAAIAGAPGQFTTLDAAARRMYYAHSRQACPRCGARGAAKGRGPLCPECGRPTTGQAPPEAAPPFDDLDELIERLETQMQRRA